ncbi:hypothetical protein SAMN05421640_2130 [Ekhidna lutea]|uniref:Uncharacterized protein n=1 Tax=Ekhidna lutea TaxID=447679 RepID=A0A239JEJ9_EKHLU|nr:hypothetical protein [Ekhidna lutea]SNT04239.1 hypothetical protein SAMN05421640_2130 [Ekhidna lutea]
MKYVFSITVLLFLVMTSFGQSTRVSTIDFVQILNDNRDEALYYYQNNWLKLREEATARGYITSYELVEVESTSEAPFDLMLMTTYPNMDAYEKAEENFGILISERGDLRLLNEKKPGEFRKSIFTKSVGKHLSEN